LVYLDWLKDPRHSAWYYGWKLPPWRRHACLALGCWLPLLPFLIYFSRQSDMRLAYQHYLPQPVTLWDWAFLLGTLLVYLFCWEWFFRGFLLFGMAQGMGAIVAILLQATLFGLAHLGKPPVEMAGAFAGGLILGAICWREKSFLPAFSAHALIHVTWAVLVLR
jgi:membrane protease YdiL (CAAX protease family)